MAETMKCYVFLLFIFFLVALIIASSSNVVKNTNITTSNRGVRIDKASSRTKRTNKLNNFPAIIANPFMLTNIPYSRGFVNG